MMSAVDGDVLKARAERFAREAKAGPPPVPKKIMAWPGGKIATSDKDHALRCLLERKARAGQPLTKDQQRALASLSNTGANIEKTAKGAPSPSKKGAASPVRGTVGRLGEDGHATSPVGAALLDIKVRNQQGAKRDEAAGESSPIGAALLARKLQNQLYLGARHD